MSTLLRSLNCVSRCSTRPALVVCRPLPTKYFTNATHSATRPTSLEARTITNSHSRLHETTLLQFIQDRIAYATHRSRLFRPLSRGGRPSGRFEDGNGGGGSRGPWFNNIPDNAVIWGILGLNGIIYLAWQRAKYDYQNMRDPSLYMWMQNNFTTSLKNLSEGRIWTLLTCAFSHEGAAHIFVNAFTFYFMAPPVLGALGKRAFFVLYLGGGLISSLTSLWFNNVYKPKANYSSHGASGAMYSVISFLACVAPRATFQLYGIIPVPAWLCVSGLFLYDAYSAMNDKQAGTDTAGHVGGVLGGIAYFLARRFRIL